MTHDADPSSSAGGDPTGGGEEALERALRAQQPYAVPIRLMSSVLEAIRHEPSHRQTHPAAMPSRKAWAAAAALLLAMGAYLAFGGPDLLAGVMPVRPLAASELDGASARDAVEHGIDGVVGRIASVTTSATSVLAASKQALGEPLLWLPIAFGSILAGLALARRLSAGRAAGTGRDLGTEPTRCAS